MSEVYSLLSLSVQSGLECENEQAANEEGSERHAGADGGNGTTRRTIAHWLARGLVGRSTVNGLGKSDELCEFLFRGGVDGEDHTLAAVFVLPAVHPDWLPILDSDVVGREFTRAICYRPEARIEALLIRGKLELAARSIERRLRCRVILRLELKNLLGFISTSGTFSNTGFTYDGVLGFGSDELRVEGKGAIGADNDAVKSAFRFGRNGGRELSFAAVGGGHSIGHSIGLGRRRCQRRLGR